MLQKLLTVLNLIPCFIYTFECVCINHEYIAIHTNLFFMHILIFIHTSDIFHALCHCQLNISSGAFHVLYLRSKCNNNTYELVHIVFIFGNHK